MSQKIVFNNLDNNVVEILSAWNIAEENLKSLKATFDAKCDEVNARIAKIEETRKNAIENGEPLDEVIAKYPREVEDNKLRALADKYHNDCKPFKSAQRAARKLVPETAYASYVITFGRGVDATGKVTIGSGKKAREVEVSQSYNNVCREFLENIGLKNQNETALRKFAEGMAFRTAGGRKSAEDFITFNGENSYNDKFIRALLRLLVLEKGVLQVCEGGKLVKTIFAD